MSANTHIGYNYYDTNVRDVLAFFTWSKRRKRGQQKLSCSIFPDEKTNDAIILINIFILPDSGPR